MKIVLNPENALMLLEGPEGRLRDDLRRAWIMQQSSEDLIHWLGTTIEAFVARHPRQTDQLRILVDEIIREKTASQQAATS